MLVKHLVPFTCSSSLLRVLVGSRLADLKRNGKKKMEQKSE